MTSLFLGHPLLFSGTLFVVLVIAVGSGFRLAARSGAAGSRPPRTSRRFPRRRVLPGKPFARAPGSTGINDTQLNSLINQPPCCEVIFLRPA